MKIFTLLFMGRSFLIELYNFLMRTVSVGLFCLFLSKICLGMEIPPPEMEAEMPPLPPPPGMEEEIIPSPPLGVEEMIPPPPPLEMEVPAEMEMLPPPPPGMEMPLEMEMPFPPPPEMEEEIIPPPLSPEMEMPLPPPMPAAPPIPPAPPVTFEQPIWPEALERKEDEVGLVKGKISSEIVDAMQEAGRINDEIQKVLIAVFKIRRNFENGFLETDKKLDSFFAKIGFSRGRAEKRIEKISTPQLAVTKTEWNQIENDIEQIDQLETDILNQLKMLDQQIEKAMNESVAARKLSADILDITDKKQIKAKLNQLNDHLRKVREIRSYLQRDFTTKFDDFLNRVQFQTQKVQQNVKRLEEKEIKIPPELAALPEEEIEEIKEEILEEELRKPQSKFFEISVNVVARVVSTVRSIGNWFADVFRQGIKKSEKETVK